MKLLQRSEAFLARCLESAATEQVEIRSGDDCIESVEATKLPRDTLRYATDDVQGSAIIQDWTLRVSDLAFPGGVRDPAPGWELWREPIGGRREVYRVLANESGRCFEALGSSGLLLTIYTKFDRYEPI